MTLREKDNARPKRLKTSLATVLIFLGFASITLFMGKTIFYPLLHFNEFVGQALHVGQQELLVERYTGYAPLIIFGIVSCILGNWLWLTKKEIHNSELAMISIPLFMTFVVILLKTIP